MVEKFQRELPRVMAYLRFPWYWRHRSKILTLDAVEFIRRFLLHILPPGLVKIRHFGFLANRNRSQAFALCRQHLPAIDPPPPPIAVLTPQQKQAMERRCPMC
jgi:hypothetical protein